MPTPRSADDMLNDLLMFIVGEHAGFKADPYDDLESLVNRILERAREINVERVNARSDEVLRKAALERKLTRAVAHMLDLLRSDLKDEDIAAADLSLVAEGDQDMMVAIARDVIRKAQMPYVGRYGKTCRIGPLVPTIREKS